MSAVRLTPSLAPAEPTQHHRDPRPGRAGSRLLLVVAVLALLGTGVLDAVLRQSAGPAARTAAAGGGGSTVGLPGSPPRADRQLPSGVPAVGTSLLPGSAPLQSLDGPGAAPGLPLAPRLLSATSSLPPAGDAASHAFSTGDSRAPPHGAGTLASLPSRP